MGEVERYERQGYNSNTTENRNQLQAEDGSGCEHKERMQRGMEEMELNIKSFLDITRQIKSVKTFTFQVS